MDIQKLKKGERYLVFQDAIPDEIINKLKNTLNGHIFETIDNEGKGIARFDFSELPTKDTKLLETLKLLFVNLNGGYKDEYQNIYNTAGTAKAVFEYIKSFVHYYSLEGYSSPDLTEWTLDDLALFGKYSAHIQGSKFKGRPDSVNDKMGTLRCRKPEFGKVIEGLRDIYKINKTHGLSVRLPKTTKLYELLYKEEVESYGIDYKNWKGSFTELPMSHSMMWLSWCIERMRSKEAQALLAFYDIVKKHDFLSRHMFFYSSCLYLSAMNGKPLPIYKKQKKRSSLKNQVFIDFKATLEEIYGEGQVPNNLPFQNLKNLGDTTKDLHTVGLTILLIVTGGRVSEIQSLNPNDLEKDAEGSYWFKSGIDKTNYNIKTLRAICGLGAEAFEFLINLGCFDKKKGNYKLLDRLRNMEHRNQEIIPEKLLSRGVKWGEEVSAFYQVFLNDVDPSFRKEHPHYHPHQSRHSWAGFAVRRFQGGSNNDIIEEIRSHFRHHYNSYMTAHYTDNKLLPNILNSMEMELKEETVRRVVKNANEQEKEYVGQVAKTIKRIVEEKTSFFTEQEAELYQEEIMNDVVSEFWRIVPHEWGYCLVRTSEMNKANCFDKYKQRPDIEESSSFDVCGSCIHRLTMTSQKEDIMRIGIMHHETAERLRACKPLADESEKIAKLAAKIIEDIENAEAV